MTNMMLSSNLPQAKKIAGVCRQYITAMKGVRKLLLLRTSPAPAGLLYVAEKRRNQPIQDPKMDHLVCFLPGKDSAVRLADCDGHWEPREGGVGFRGQEVQEGMHNYGET